MKKFYGLILVLGGLIVGCSNNSNEVSSQIENISVNNSENKIAVEQKDFSNVKLLETISYEGKIRNIDIHMTLNFYENGDVSGSYFYDKYKQDIELVGNRSYNTIKLQTLDGVECFVGQVNSDNITGDWSTASSTLAFEVYIVSDDKYVVTNRTGGGFISYGDYVYIANYCGLSRINVADGYREDLSTKRFLNILGISNEEIYLNYNNEVYKCALDGSDFEQVNIDYRGFNTDYIMDIKMYKDRLYFYSQYLTDGMSETGIVMSTDLKGEGRNVVSCPTLEKVGLGGKTVYFETLFIYNDNIYFGTINTDSSNSGNDEDVNKFAYRMDLDGSDVQKVVTASGDIFGCMGEYVFDGWNKDNSSVSRNFISYSTSEEPQNLYNIDEAEELELDNLWQLLLMKIIL